MTEWIKEYRVGRDRESGEVWIEFAFHVPGARDERVLRVMFSPEEATSFARDIQHVVAETPPTTPSSGQRFH
ncbi:MAG: hypothetical protein OXG72_19080 [Acidobacteria bacterium]|nr:hypothetical protein [Acidobacteriota bacterium]